jgi:hypothetical protein
MQLNFNLKDVTESFMKTNKVFSTVLAVTTTYFAMTTAHAQYQTYQPRVQSDIPAILSAGTGFNQDACDHAAVKIEKGTYQIGALDGVRTRSLLFVEPYINVPGQFLAVWVDENEVEKEESSTARFYMGRTARDGSSVMLSPLQLNQYGNIVSTAQTDDRAQVIRINLREDSNKRFAFPYALTGYHGAMGGQTLGMRKANDSTQILSIARNSRMFEYSNNYSKIIASPSGVQLNISGQEQVQYSALDMNGSGGKFSALVRSEFNAINDSMTQKSAKMERIAFYVSSIDQRQNTGYRDSSFTETQNSAVETRQILVIGTPTGNGTDFKLNFYGKERRTFWDLLFAGSK